MEALIEPEGLAAFLATSAIQKKGTDVVILDMRELVSYTDYFVLVTASNRRHVQAIADYARRQAKQELGLQEGAIEGREAARWVLVDFGDVVLHVFDEPMRGFYDLDGLWRDAPRPALPEVEPIKDDAEPVFSWPGA